MIPIPLFTFEIFSWIWWWKFNFSSRYKPRCFWYGVWATGIVLKVVVGRFILLVFLEKITSCACLGKSGLKTIFHLYTQSEIFFRSSIYEDCKPSGGSLMYIRKSNHPKIEPRWTPASTGDQLKHCSLTTTLWNLLFRKLLRKLGRFPDAFDISKKFAVTLRVGQN